MKIKHDTLSQNINADLEAAKEHEALMTFLDSAIKKADKGSDEIKAIYELKRKLQIQHDKTLSDKQQLDKIGKEISHMKAGSIAVVSSIMTVSKMRIYDPRSARGVLHGIRLSADSMNAINEKMKELFIFS